MANQRVSEGDSLRARRGGRSWLGLVGWMLSAAAAGAIGGIASRNAESFYASLVRPSWAPPASLFGPVWTTLYVLMGIAAWLVWRAERATHADRAVRQRGLVLFVVQLALNALWSWLFFEWRQGALAFGEVVVLLIAVLATMWHFGRVRALAAWCLVPYLGWITFAAALTWSVWQANPDLLASR